MTSRFTAATESSLWSQDDRSLTHLLRSEHLYKSLSLLLSIRIGVKAPASLLLLASRRDLLSEFADEWGLPLMIRMDYRRRPTSKPIGGVPLHKLSTAYRVSEDLLDRGYCPLFHQNLNRFEDVYSAGILLKSTGRIAECEVVGEGFDAGDLRLGKAVPHETIAWDLASGNRLEHRTIADDLYERDRVVRARTIRRLTRYIDTVNKLGRLPKDFTELNDDRDLTVDPRLPVHYQPLPDQLWRELQIAVGRLHKDVIPNLPASTVYAASLSYMKREGWVLWDIYGGWYNR